MTPGALALAKKIATYTLGVAALVATISGAVTGIAWGAKTIGVVPVALIGAFMLGCVLTAAVMNARTSR